LVNNLLVVVDSLVQQATLQHVAMPHPRRKHQCARGILHTADTWLATLHLASNGSEEPQPLILLGVTKLTCKFATRPQRADAPLTLLHRRSCKPRWRPPRSSSSPSTSSWQGTWSWSWTWSRTTSLHPAASSWWKRSSTCACSASKALCTWKQSSQRSGSCSQGWPPLPPYLLLHSPRIVWQVYRACTTPKTPCHPPIPHIMKSRGQLAPTMLDECSCGAWL
jgi:hypothetical protein